MKTMKAIVKTDPVKGASMKEVPVPVPGSKDVLVKVRATAVCGTDLHIYEWNKWAAGAVKRLPLIMGHECCGDVVEVGSEVTTLIPGDFVAAETHIPCGVCYQCRNGMQHICGDLRLFGIHQDGCFAEYAVIPEICAPKIDERVPPQFAAILEPFGVGIRAAQDIRPDGATVAVIGCGPIGLGTIAALGAMGAARIIGMDPSEDRRERARAIGASETIDPVGADIVSLMLERTNGVGVDAFVDASGVPKAISQGFKYLRKGGKAVLVGLPSEPVTLDLVPDIVFREATVFGVHGRRMFETWTIMQNLIAEKRVDLAPMVSHEFPLERFGDAISLLSRAKGSKILLYPSS